MVITPEVRKSVIAAYRGRCQYCKRKIEDETIPHIDHIDPRSKGGKDELENYTLACHLCNLQKNGTPIPEPGRSLLLAIAQRKAPGIRKKLQKLATEQIQEPRPPKERKLSVAELRGKTWDRVPVSGLEDGLEIIYEIPVKPIGIVIYTLLVRIIETCSWEYHGTEDYNDVVYQDVDGLMRDLEIDRETLWSGIKWLCRLSADHPGGGFCIVSRASISNLREREVIKFLVPTLATRERILNALHLLIPELAPEART